MTCNLTVKIRPAPLNSEPLEVTDLQKRRELLTLVNLPNNFKASGKRIFDLVLTIPGIIILIPVIIVLAVWIRLDSPGPVLFRQFRVGKNGRDFLIYKFRTMYDGAEASGKLFTLERDERITGCGKILRKFKLDELPQLFNVLKGDMSLVGPRPMLPGYLAKYPAKFRKVILSVPPGITDYASVFYINENKMLNSMPDPEKVYLKEVLQTKLSYALYYISKRSLVMDLRIILITLMTLFGMIIGKDLRLTRGEYIRWK